MPGSWSDFLKLRSGPAPPPSSEAGAVRVYADADGALRSVQSDGTDAAIGDAGSISVTDGSTTVDPATSLDFTGATVTDEGSGVAGVSVGGSPAYESGFYEQSGGATTIPNGGLALLPFDDFAGGTAVLDITNPIHPLVLKAGLFVVSVEVTLTSVLTAGGSFGLALTLDFTGEAIEMRNGAVADGGLCEVSSSWVMAAGAQFRLQCSNFDGAADRDFFINNATVSRVGPA